MYKWEIHTQSIKDCFFPGFNILISSHEKIWWKKRQNGIHFIVINYSTTSLASTNLLNDTNLIGQILPHAGTHVLYFPNTKNKMLSEDCMHNLITLTD